MPNTTNREVAHKHRVKKRKWTAKNQANLANAKKKTLEELHKLGRLPKSLYSRLGINYIPGQLPGIIGNPNKSVSQGTDSHC